MMTMTFNGDEQDQMALGHGSITTVRRSKGGTCFGLVFGVVFLLLGLGFAGYAFWEWFTTSDIESWPSAEGIIESATVTSSTDDDGTTYSPQVTFSYSVNDQRYTGDKVTYWSNHYDSFSEAQAVINRYPVRTEKPVYYDPDKPSRAVLDPTRQTTNMFIMMAVGGLFAVVGLVIVIAVLYGKTS